MRLDQYLVNTFGFTRNKAQQLIDTDLVFLRAGAGNFQNVTQLDNTEKINFQPNIGLGFKYKGIQVDYALTDLGNQSTALYSNIFSLKVDLGIFR